MAQAAQTVMAKDCDVQAAQTVMVQAAHVVMAGALMKGDGNGGDCDGKGLW